MRLTRIYSLTLIVSASALILATGCKKNNDNNNSQGSISATVGSTNFSSGATQGGFSRSADFFILLGYNVQNKDTSGFILTIPGDIKAGKTIAADTSDLDIAYITPDGKTYDAWMYSGKASMTINSLDTVGHKISGVFTATAYNTSSTTDSVVITNGKFSSSYTVTN